MRCRLFKPLAKHWVAWLLLWLGIATSAILGYLTARDLESELHVGFQRNVDDTTMAIEARLNAYTEVLYGVRGLFAGSQGVAPEEFEDYVASLDLASRYPGIQAISYYPRVTHEQKAAFERNARALRGAYAAFSIVPRGERPEYYPIYFRARFLEESPLLLGADQVAEPARRAGIEYARDTGVLSATGPLDAWNGNPSEIGVVMRLALYRRGAPVATPQDRRQNVIGVVGAAFNVRHLIESVARSNPDAQLSLTIHDAGRAGADTPEGNRAPKLLYTDGRQPLPGAKRWLSASDWTATREFNLGGRRWRATFTPGAGLPLLGMLHAFPIIVFLGGILASVLMFAFIRSVALSGDRAQRLADSMVRKLMASERRIAETEKFSAVMVLNSDLDGRLLKTPPTFCRLLGYAEDELLNRRFQDLTHPEDLDATMRARERLTNGETRTVEIEKRYLHRDGGMVWAAINLTLVVDDAGAPLQFLSYVRDITAEKRAEEELRCLYSELEHRVEQRTADLQAANRELESFSYSVSHDLRAPVRHIAGYVNMLKRGAASRLEEGDRRFLDQIAAAASRMGGLIDDLLGFSRTSRAELRVERVDMGEIVGRALDQLAPEMAQRNIRVEIAALPAATADAGLLHQVWVNLLSNAIKYTAPRAEAVIEVGTLAGEGSEHVYFVRDNGVGFDMGHAGKLFGVFQRLHTRAEFEGTGIGLALVHRIVSRHGGRVWAESRMNEGAIFCFALPESGQEEERLSA